jgi:hypothetical protein
MGDFLFVPGSSPDADNGGALYERGAKISLPWSATTLQELATAMDDLERKFLSSWRRAGLPMESDGGRTRNHKHA